ncbi:hypothetical protein OXPF_06140 [Oxobacter pfennigii]|uniref:Phage portal protein n=1 Tax=Oxobacter pfennigii TaxID=36849 RepID=A0A0P8Z118_9CLOT|nr:YmfQ family protein [Oxobacter pfennigii]KPU45825.1 hypothetical protein OXPF_06140 [Oxobacter pfennigii]
MYGQYQYGVLQFGASVAEGAIEPYIPDLMRYLSPYYTGVREMEEIQGSISEEMGLLKYGIDETLKQFFVSTATWGLDIWERELGLTTDHSKPYERRREIITAKLRGAGTTTKDMIKSVASAFSGGEVDVIEYPGEYRFEVQFIGVMGIPPNMAGLMQAIDEIKPAHLTCSFKYTYTWWDTLKSLTWQQAGTRTWNQLRIYEGE